MGLFHGFERLGNGRHDAQAAIVPDEIALWSWSSSEARANGDERNQLMAARDATR